MDDGREKYIEFQDVRKKDLDSLEGCEEKLNEWSISMNRPRSS